MSQQTSKFILSGLIAATASFALPASSSAQISGFDVFLDGQFSIGGEWSDVTPNAFFSAPGQTAIPLNLANPDKNVLLYAAISHNVDSAPGDLQLHLMYDFLPRTPGTPFGPGETFASVTFPVTLPGTLGGGGKQNISVLFQGGQFASAPGGGGTVGGFFDIFVDLDLDGIADLRAGQLGILGAAGFGPSSLSGSDHLLVELEVPLRIDLEKNPEFTGGPLGGGAGGGGINPATGLYDPDPVFWGASGSGDDGSGTGGGSGGPLQSASAATIQINPNGSLTVTPGVVPEPTSAALLLAGLGFLGARRRR